MLDAVGEPKEKRQRWQRQHRYVVSWLLVSCSRCFGCVQDPGRTICQGLSVGTMQTLDQDAFEKQQPGSGRFDLMVQASEVDEDL